LLKKGRKTFGNLAFPKTSAAFPHPVLSIYNVLSEVGFSITFLTRAHTGPSRAGRDIDYFS